MSPRTCISLLALALAACDGGAGDAPPATIAALTALASGQNCPPAKVFAPGVITTDRDEGGVVFARDGRTLFFHRRDERGFLHILTSQRSRGGWSPPAVLPFANFAWDDWDPSFTPDGRQLFFTSRRPAAPGRTDANIWRVWRTHHGWSEPELVGGEINTLAVDGSTSFAADGTIYFTSNRAGGSGNFDLWFARPAGDGFGPVENVGPVVNGPQLELHPEISRDGSVLFFASFPRPDSLGGPDLYATVRVFGEFIAPFNLGACVNSAAAEAKPTLGPRGRSLLYSRDVGKGGDVLEIPLPGVLVGNDVMEE